ncbi:hypothetical protein CDL15_Pgr006860 [Punica granatum]|uniref:DNA ligase 1 n=1 Tax=Punica granatum TaxID=22663 RepID=A0A218X7Z9_PUNGR|nr:hypothetical protein CDL15_Pgr006860 [Punica granatum]
MESDDDFEFFSTAEAEPPSPQSHVRKLKRLRRAAEVVTPHPLIEPAENDLPSVHALDSADSEPVHAVESNGAEAEEPSDGLQHSAAKNGTEDDTAGFGSVAMEPEKEDELQQVSEFDSLESNGAEVEDPSDGLQHSGAENGTEDDTTGFGSVTMEPDKESELQQISEFDLVDEEINVGDEPREGSEDLITRAPEDNLQQVGPSETKRKKKKKKKDKKKRTDSSTDDDNDQIKATHVINKRREEKERRDRMQQLRADSQRVLRESRDASFKPIPMVLKPISSVLEKIRQRKLEMSKKTVSVKSTNLASRYFDFSEEEDVDIDLNDSVLPRGGDGMVPGSIVDEAVAEPTETRTIPDVGPIGGPDDIADDLSPESAAGQKTLHEELKPAFQAPIDDTQESFPDCENNETKEDAGTDSPSSPVEEVFAPSELAMKLKFDSALMSDDEEDNDKENIDFHLVRDVDLSLPIKDPVKDFLDEEAEEEDDSDGDPFNGQDDEDEDIEDAEELNDMIATNYTEKPRDNEMRNELHQKWLEQQDAAGMENLLQRVKGAPKQREATLLEEEEDQEEEEDEDSEEEFGEDNEEGLPLKTLAQMNLRKAKQTISEMFTEKDDAYISSEDEESERILIKQSLSEKIEGQAKLLSPAEDESSREVFSRIKKLNIVPENKRRAKPSALHDLSLASGRVNSFLKPSFLGKGSSSLPSKNQKSSAFRSFIFGRDDSNSRSTESASEESPDTVQRDSRPIRTPSAKFRSPQTKPCTHSAKVSAEADSTTSLYDILRRPPIKSDSCVRDVVDVRTKSIFAAFRLGKRSREGRVVM